MGDLIAVDFKSKRSLGRIETEQQELTMMAFQVLRMVPDVLYESSMGYVAPDKDPA